MKYQIIRIIAALFLSIQFNLESQGTSYFVSLQGNNLSTGSFDLPFLTIEKGISVALPGDTVFVRGGKFTVASTIRISKSGLDTLNYHLMAFPGERVLLDCSGQAFGSSNRGILLTGSFWHIEGFDIFGAGDNGMKIETGGHNRIINCAFYRNRDSGLQIGNGSSFNQVINCDSYYNADPPDYGDADGFAAKLDVGDQNYFYGCRAWQNCDDGWDGYLRGTDNVSTIIQNSWAFDNGYLEDGTDPGPQANGNGFKMGGSDDKTLSHNYTLTNCLSFNNKAKGFDQNSNMGSMILYNCTGHNNLGGNFVIYKALAPGKELIIKNSSVLGETGNIAAFAFQAANSWMGGIVATDEDFISIDQISAYQSRKPDGSLPDINYLYLAEGSDMIDAGVDVGLVYYGNSPDIGYVESDYNPSTGIRNIITQNAKVICFPNPASEFVSFNIATGFIGEISVIIYDLAGRKVHQSRQYKNTPSDLEFNIPLNHVKPGLYFYQVFAGKTVPSAGKFIVR